MKLETSESRYGIRVSITHDDGRPMARCYVALPCRTLLNVETYPSFTRQGVGKFMMQEVMKLPQHPTNLTCAPFGSHRLTMDQTQNFYERFGFVPVGKTSGGVPMQFVCDNLSS